jgi:peptidoglycan/xylan/chitin deacetylase (PgdA/CDA1 family)
VIRRLYGWVHRKAPVKWRGRLVKAAFALADKPSVGARSPAGFSFPGGAPGCLVFSADFELAWAWRFAKGFRGAWEETVKRERDNVPALLALFGSRSIPVTWATVGHLLLDGCAPVELGGSVHPELPRLPHFENRVWSFEAGDWFQDDPCTDFTRDPLWYAPDLVRAIREAPAGHELACHTFSHIDMTDARCPAAVAEAELAMCLRLAGEEGLQMTSFVFPGGTYGNFSVLKRHGFLTYRMQGSTDLAFPELDAYGLVRLPSSTGLEDEGYGWSQGYTRKRYRRYMERAVETGTVGHFWFHPSMRDTFLERDLPGILDDAREMAESGKLWIATMGQCARHCLPWLRGEAPRA